MGLIFVFSLLFIVCIAALTRPAIGLLGFYGFMLLDPAWNWRWALPPGIPYQKYIFFSLFAGFVLSGFQKQDLSKWSRRGIYSLSAFFAICWVSSLQSVSPQASEFLLSVFWKQVLVIILGILILGTPDRLKALLIVAVLAQGYNAFQINLDYFQTGVMRFALTPWGTSRIDNNAYSLVTIPLIAVSISLGLFEKVVWKRLLYFGIAMLQIHQIMLLQSRGSMVGGMLMLVVLLIKMPRRNGNILWVSCGVLAGVMLAGPSVVKEFSSSFAAKGERDTSADSRFQLWKAGTRITMDYPLLGCGPNAARVLVPKAKYYDGGLNQSKKALHNLFFDVSTGMGIPGVFTYFFFFCAPIIYCYWTYNPLDDETGAARLAVFSGSIGYLASSMFSSGILFESCYILVVVGYGLSNFDFSRSIGQDRKSVDNVTAPHELVLPN